jgi:hypothetical protein
VIEDLASSGMIFAVFVRQSLGNLGIPAPDAMSMDLNMDRFSYMAHLRTRRPDHGRAYSLRILTNSQEKRLCRMSIFSIGYGCYRQNPVMTSEPEF